MGLTGKHLYWRSLFWIELQVFVETRLKQMFSCGVYETFKIRTTGSETCCFTWSVLLNNSHFWLKLVHGFCIIIYSFACQFSLHITAIIRSSRLVVFCKKVFLQTLQNSQENTCARVLFLMKLRIHRVCNFIKKRDFGTNGFLWILRNFSWHLF